MIPFLITLGIAIFGIYYVTIFLHFMGGTLYGKRKIKFGLALIPFFYWLTSEKEAIEIPIAEKVAPITPEVVVTKTPRKPRKPSSSKKKPVAKKATTKKESK